MSEEFTSLEDILKAHYAKDTKHFPVFANVLVPSFHTRWHQLSKGGWTVIPTSGGTKFYKEFSNTSTPTDWINSIDSLNRLLLAYFINDFAPRKIHSFEFPQNLEAEELMPLITVFGNSQVKPLRIEDQATLSFHMSGDLFNWKTGDPNEQIDDHSIGKWYGIFENETLFTSVSLLQEAFILINRQFSEWSHYSFVNFSMGIILLVSALENLFTYKQENHADIRFKFQVIGSLYYQKNVTVDFLQKFDAGVSTKKFSQSEFRQILKELYDLRSAIAHGSYSKVLKGNNWKKLLGLLKVHYDNSFNQAILSKHAALALGMLQKHILALIIQSEADLLKGVDIIDEVKIDELNTDETSS